MFQLVYGIEVVVLAEFITPRLYIAQVTHMKNGKSVVERVVELLELDEAQFLVDFHQTVEKDRHKSWNDRHIKIKTFV